jgi:hypothetical protein
MEQEYGKERSMAKHRIRRNAEFKAKVALAALSEAKTLADHLHKP